MTIEEFNSTGFTGGMKVVIGGKEYEMTTVDFEDKTIEFICPEDGRKHEIHCCLCEKFIK